MTRLLLTKQLFFLTEISSIANVGLAVMVCINIARLRHCLSRPARYVGVWGKRGRSDTFWSLRTVKGAARFCVRERADVTVVIARE